MNDEEKKAHDKQMIDFLEQKAREIAEHFPDCQILASFVDDEGTTICRNRGMGNYYARLGMAKEFIDLNTSRELANDIGDQMRRIKDEQ